MMTHNDVGRCCCAAAKTLVLPCQQAIDTNIVASQSAAFVQVAVSRQHVVGDKGLLMLTHDDVSGCCGASSGLVGLQSPLDRIQVHTRLLGPELSTRLVHPAVKCSQIHTKWHRTQLCALRNATCVAVCCKHASLLGPELHMRLYNL